MSQNCLLLYRDLPTDKSHYDIEDEYHILMKCKYFVNLREKYISKKYYKRPSMYKFQKLMNTTKRELYRLMLFIKCIFKEYNSRLTEV